MSVKVIEVHYVDSCGECPYCDYENSVAYCFDRGKQREIEDITKIENFCYYKKKNKKK